jgi:hypothetical protein
LIYLLCRSGVFNDVNCVANNAHAMNVVGYGTLNTVKYWVNSLVSRKEDFYSVLLKTILQIHFKIRSFVILGAVDGELLDTFLSSEVLTCA